METSNQSAIISHDPEFSFVKAVKRLISGFSPRIQQILKDRFGISESQPKTLEDIGKSQKITRERVRQIVQESMKKLRLMEQDPDAVKAKELILFTISKKNGIMEENKLIRQLGKGNRQEEASVRFFLVCFDNFEQIEFKGEFKKSYALEGLSLEYWKKIKNIARNILESEKRTLTEDELFVRISHRIGSDIGGNKITDYLDVSEEIKKNNFGKWGLADWEEINPKNTREKAYLVLKEAAKPLHFTKIAELIDEYKLSKRKTHYQTVHNELIKDERFILVGRGVYALRDWGFREGTVKQILEEILKKNAKPMNREEILERVMKLRQVKKSTIMINLNNFFVRTDKNEYTVGN